MLRKQHPARAWIGDLHLDMESGSVRLTAPTPFGSPVYRAGIDQDDQLLSLDGTSITSPDTLTEIVHRHKPGEQLTVIFTRRGRTVTTPIMLAEDPHLEIVATEVTGTKLSDVQRRFRDLWLGSAVR